MCYTMKLYFMESFGEKLNTLRIQRKLTVHQLAERANVPASLLYGLKTDSRVIGENNATKIGVALGLTGKDLEMFVFEAINHASERVLQQYKSYPAEVINFLAIRLQALGIPPDQISRCILDPQFKHTEGDAALILNDGTRAMIDLNITYQ